LRFAKVTLRTGGRKIMLPLLQLKEFDQYTTTHSMNVAVLSMALAEFIGLSATRLSRGTRRVGVRSGALLRLHAHDAAMGAAGCRGLG
jgi:HD-GYP domain-containing protein (c-di-GMP phosphodiesterase class II)